MGWEKGQIFADDGEWMNGWACSLSLFVGHTKAGEVRSDFGREGGGMTQREEGNG